MFLVHELVNGLDDAVVPGGSHKGVSHLNLLLRVVLDHLMPHLDISSIGMMARTCKSLRVMTSNGTLLDHLLLLLPQINSEQTRRRFLIPRSVALRRISRGVYSQPHGLKLAIDKYGGMDGFRKAVQKRHTLTIKRRKLVYDRYVQKLVTRANRLTVVSDAFEVVGLPPGTHLSYPAAILFVNNIPAVNIEIEDYRLSRIVECACWLYYLHHYTDFCERCESRREIMGDYPGLERDILQEYDKPLVWPWLA